MNMLIQDGKHAIDIAEHCGNKEIIAALNNHKTTSSDNVNHHLCII